MIRNRLLSRISRKWLLVPPLLLGLATLVFAVQNRQTPERNELVETARPLRVATVQRRRVAPTVVGHGVAMPARTWRAVAEVDGRVVETHPRLEPGEIIEKGAVLVRIDPADYELRRQRLLSQADALAAQIRELETTRKNDAALLEIEKQSLEIVRRDLKRHDTLLERNAVAEASRDSIQRQYLTQQRQVRSLQNSLNLLPVRIARLEAEREAIRRQIEQAQRDLDRTTLTAPFRCRLASVEIEPGQYVGPGERLFKVHGLDAAEIEARVALDDLRLLAPGESSGDVATVAESLRGLEAVVRVRSGDWIRQWPGRLVRIREQVQRKTRTLGVVVRVERPYHAAAPNNPPLLEGVFCEVEFRGKPRPPQLVVPRAALRDKRLYVVNEENRLETRTVTTLLPVGEIAMVAGGVEEGERVVLSDPTPAVEGMLVDPVSDPSPLETQVALVP